MIILFYILCVLVVILYGITLIEQFIIPCIRPNNKFVIWWKKHIIDEDPYHDQVIKRKVVAVHCLDKRSNLKQKKILDMNNIKQKLAYLWKNREAIIGLTILLAILFLGLLVIVEAL